MFLVRYCSAALVFALSTSAQIIFLIGPAEGQNGNNGLSAQGLSRAQCLRTKFGGFSNFDIGYIISEMATNDGQTPSFETVRPVADDLGITIDTSCGANDASCVKNLIGNFTQRDLGGNVLICLNSINLAGIVDVIGGVVDTPAYPSNSYNIIWTDPAPYNKITHMTSEECLGLDPQPPQRGLGPEIVDGIQQGLGSPYSSQNKPAPAPKSDGMPGPRPMPGSGSMPGPAPMPTPPTGDLPLITSTLSAAAPTNDPTKASPPPLPTAMTIPPPGPPGPPKPPHPKPTDVSALPPAPPPPPPPPPGSPGPSRG